MGQGVRPFPSRHPARSRRRSLTTRCSGLASLAAELGIVRPLASIAKPRSHANLVAPWHWPGLGAYERRFGVLIAEVALRGAARGAAPASVSVLTTSRMSAVGPSATRRCLRLLRQSLDSRSASGRVSWQCHVQTRGPGFVNVGCPSSAQTAFFGKVAKADTRQVETRDPGNGKLQSLCPCNVARQRTSAQRVLASSPFGCPLIQCSA